MGFTKSYLMEVEARGWDDSTEIICCGCLDDQALVGVVVVNADAALSPCSFCGAVAATRSYLNAVVERIVDSLKAEYDDPINEAIYDSREGGYQTDLEETSDLLAEHEVSGDTAVLTAIDRVIRNTLWCQRDLAAPPPGMGLAWSWDQFREEVRVKRRFTFLHPDPSAATEAGMFKVHEVPAAVTDAVHLARLVIELSAGDSWFRARLDPGGATHSSASAIGSPPVQHSRSNRMTPAGIGAFYGASTRGGAIGEVSKYAAGGKLSIGEFKLAQRLRVVDLRTPPPVPSLFDAGRRHLRPATIFLREFVESISEPTVPGGTSTEEELTYIPTQIIAEFLRYALPDGSVDGVIWQSTVVDDVDCCVLFVSNEECADLGVQTPTTRLILDPRTVSWEDVTA
jgi:hypothetical protein